MFKLTLLAVAALFSFAGVGNATTLDVLLGTGGAVSYSTGGTLAPNINLMSSPGLLLGAGSLVIDAGTSINGFIVAPTGSLYGSTYLALMGGGGIGVPVNGQATFSLANNGNTFGFTWGSVHSFESVTLTAANGTSYTVSGADINAANPGALGGQVDVIFSDPSSFITQIQLNSTGLAFNAGNFSGSSNAVPLPASAVLFAMALAGLALVASRRKQGSV